MRPPRAAPGPTAARLGLGAVAALAAILGFAGLGATSFWLDEALSAIHATLPLDDYVDYMVREPHQMKAYIVVLRGWMLLGESEFALRTLSVLFAVAAVVATHVLGSRLCDVRVGLLAALVLTLNGFHLRYAREARAYSLVAFLAVLASIQFVAMLRLRDGRPTRRLAWTLPVAYAVTSAIAAYAHSFAVLVNVAHAASLVFLPRGRVPWRRLFGSAAVMTVLLVPLAIMNLTDDEPGRWSWIAPSGLAELHGLFLHLTGYAGWPALAAYAVLCAAALAGPVRDKTPSPGEDATFARWRVAFLAFWLLIPVAVIFTVSFWKPALIPRYLIMCVPPLALLAGAGLASIRRPALLAGALVAFLFTALPGLAFTYRKPYEEDWRGAAAHVLSRAREGDGLIFHIGAGRQAFDWYRGRLDAVGAPPATLFPRSRRSLPQALDSLPDGVSRVWLVLSLHGGPDDRALTDDVLDPRLRALYPAVEEREFPRIRVRLYAQPSARSP